MELQKFKNKTIQLVNFGSPITFIVSPLITLLVNFFLLACTRTKTSKINLLLTSFYLGLLNSTKKIESDLENYFNYYEAVKETSFLEYIFLLGKEPAFMVFNYCSFYLTAGNFEAYIILYTTISYYLLLSSINNYFNSLNIDKSLKLLAIIIIVFLPQIFSISAHLNRQFLATSIFIYGFVNQIFLNKKSILLYVLAIFTHSTIIFFIPLIFWERLKKNIGLKTILYGIITLTCFNILKLELYNLLVNYFGNNLFTYIIERTLGTSHELEPIGLQAWAYILLMLSIILVRYNDSITIHKSIKHLFNIILILFTFIVVNVHQSELAKRFLFYVYIFSPFIIPLIISNEKHKHLIISGTGFILITFFFYKIEFGIWTYAPFLELMFQPILNYFITQ